MWCWVGGWVVQEVRVFCSTWNMGSLKRLPRSPHRLLEEWLPRHGYDLYAGKTTTTTTTRRRGRLPACLGSRCLPCTHSPACLPACLCLWW